MTSTVQPSTDQPGRFTHRSVAVIRHRYDVSGYPPVPWLHTESVFSPREVSIEVATNADQTVLSVSIQGDLIVDTDDGPLVTTHPAKHEYGAEGTNLASNLGDMPAWVTALVQDATTRTREAWA